MTKGFIKRVDLENRLHALCAAQRITAQDAIDIAILPAADVAPVVRCRDCRWRHDDSYPMWLPCVEVETDPDWFCADGERREVQDGN